ncbi:DUF262 domain-containing protein [Sphingomonas sp. DG1-23]|uniref:DUF262 domain-containing protein n=1 Tax=Sphingomonas sp. DG1-23 TaxID=3068316 RepID=UPI00273D2DA3|nr:DUF262 domain-containing protein [Sphingomonas sp. DG1-23]MDP5279191.1 DUF262 domain-containing protein [Sphingomonas sp. DG1-23]
MTDTAVSGSKAPKPEVERVEELARRVLSADILLPKFQRDFVWTKKQVLDLWDSIASDYPIGSILLWRSREELRAERHIADLAIAEPKDEYPVNYLLDGQQRLSSVCGALYWNGSDPESQWNIAYDLRSKRFLHLSNLDAPPNHQVRLNWLPDPATYFTQLNRVSSEKDETDLRLAGNALFTRLKDYKIAAVTLFGGSLNDIAPIFERINSRGTPLTIVDLMRAATWSEDFDLFDAIDNLRSSISIKGFNDIDRKVILRSFSASAGGGFSEGSIDDLRKHKADDLNAASKSTEAAYKLAIDFLSTDLGIPSDKHIPYINQLVVIAEIFRLLPKPDATQRLAMKRWFWRTSASGYFGGWNTGNMAADQQAAKDFALGKTAEIATSAATPNAEVWKNQQFRLNTAHAKILSQILAFNNPIDFLTGQLIDIDKALHYQNTKEYHHFFPRDYLINKGVPARRANALANFVMLTADSNKKITNRAPSDYLQECQQKLGSDFKKAMETNLISDAALSAAMSDDFDEFIVQRANTIQSRVNELIS